MTNKISNSILHQYGGKKEAFQNVLAQTAGHFDVSKEEILGSSRRRGAVIARMYLVCRLIEDLQMGFSEIARRMHKDHTTIMYHWQKANALKAKESQE